MSTTSHPPRQQRSIATEMASRISRDSLLYTMVTVTAFPLALVNTGVLARFLSLSVFGYLAIVMFWAGMMTIALNMLVLRGIERHVWGGSEDMMDVAGDDVVGGSLRARALGTGLVLNVGIATVAGLAVALNAGTLCRLLLLPPSFKTAVIWAGASGGLGSIWRLATGILRWERRRTAFSTVYIMRWVVALGLSWPLLVAGYGPTGVVASTALGSLVSLLTALVLARKSYRPGLQRSAVRAIAHKNMPMVAMILGLTILHDADVFLLSRVAPASEVGLYRLATRMTSFVSYAVSAFLIAWSPLEASSLFRATYAEIGRARVRANFVSYYVIVGAWLVLLMCITAVPVIAVVAPRYSRAAGFVPLTSIAYLAYGFLVVVARSSEFPHRYVIYGSATLGGAAVMIFVCLTLGGPLGGYGVALGDLIGALVGVGVVVGACVLSRRRPAIDVPRVAGALLIGGVCFAVGMPLAQQSGVLHPLLGVCAIALYPVLLVLARVVPRSHLAMMGQIVRDLRAWRRDRGAMIARLGELPAVQQRVMLALLRDRQPVDRVSQLAGMPVSQVSVELVRGLRGLSATPGTDEYDEEIGRWLLSTDAVTSKDAVQRRIEDDGATPAEIHAIEAAFTALRSAPAKAWSAATASPAVALPDPPWPVSPQVLALLDGAVRDEVPRSMLAATNRLTERELDRRLVGGLRSLAGLPARASLDRMIAAFLLDRRDAPPSRQLWSAGVDPIELHELELVVAAIRSMPPQRLAAGAGSQRRAWSQRQPLRAERQRQRRSRGPGRNCRSDVDQ